MFYFLIRFQPIKSWEPLVPDEVHGLIWRNPRTREAKFLQKLSFISQKSRIQYHLMTSNLARPTVCSIAVGDIRTYLGYPVIILFFAVTMACFSSVNTSIPSNRGYVYKPNYFPLFCREASWWVS